MTHAQVEKPKISSKFSYGVGIINKVHPKIPQGLGTFGARIYQRVIN
jgi:hypothetical protein